MQHYRLVCLGVWSSLFMAYGIYRCKLPACIYKASSFAVLVATAAPLMSSSVPLWLLWFKAAAVLPFHSCGCSKCPRTLPFHSRDGCERGSSRMKRLQHSHLFVNVAEALPFVVVAATSDYNAPLKHSYYVLCSSPLLFVDTLSFSSSIPMYVRLLLDKVCNYVPSTYIHSSLFIVCMHVCSCCTRRCVNGFNT